MWDTLPKHLLVLVAKALQPSPFKMPIPPVRTVAAFVVEEQEQGRSSASRPYKEAKRCIEKAWRQHKAACKAMWRSTAAMSSVCNDWRCAAYEAIDSPPAWLLLSKALDPPGRWHGSQITSLYLLVPAKEVHPCRGVEAWQKEVCERLHELYPKLVDSQLHWQVRIRS